MRWPVIGLLTVILALAVACSPAPTPTPTPESLSAPDVDYRAVLAALDTYRARASLDVYPVGETGRPKAHLEVEVDAINRPERARRTTIRGLRSMAKPEERKRTSDVLKFVEVGGDLYMSTGATWVKTPAQNDPEQGILDPALLIPDPELLIRTATGVEVNGVRADHYTFSAVDALAYLSPEERETVVAVAGNVWLAQEGNFIVRYRATVHGDGFRFDFSPEPFAGRLEVAYDLYGVNEPLRIERPQAALGERPDVEEKPVILDGFGGRPFPLPVDASVTMRSRQLVVFNTGMTPDEVARLYARELEPLGWTLAEEQAKSASLRQIWQKEGYELRLTVVRGRTGMTHVTVGVNPGP